MKLTTLLTWGVLLVVIPTSSLASVSVSLCDADPAARPWTISESIRVRYFPATRSAHDEEAILWAPDRAHFAFVSRRGDLQEDTTVYTLHVFSTSEVQAWANGYGRGRPPSPTFAITRPTGSSGTPAIERVQWGASSRRLFFRGETEGTKQVFDVDIENGSVRQRTHHDTDINWYVADGAGLVFGAISELPVNYRYPMQAAERYSFEGEPDLGSPVVTPFVSTSGRSAVYAQFGNRATRQLAFDIDTRKAWLSPNGAMAIALVEGSLTLIHTRSGRSEALQSASEHASAIWRNASEFVVMDAPIVSEAGDGRVISVPYRVNAGRAERISGERAMPDRRGTDASPTAATIEVAIEQSANLAPEIVVSTPEWRGSLLGADDALEGTCISRQVTFQWEEAPGASVTGALYLPLNHRVGFRAPLIVQPYRYSPDLFRPDGDNTTVDAAQLLAARGFAVLKYDLPRIGEADEGSAALRRFDSAVRALAVAGVVDPTLVGLTGFSRAGYQALYIITHPGETRIAAAIGADSTTLSFASYASGAAIGHDRGEFETGRGGPFSRNPITWLEEDPTFNVDRVVTPFLYSFNGAGSSEMYPPEQSQLVGMFALNRRPLEYLFFPNGVHQLHRPQERVAMLEATVDWMAFWILGEEDSDHGKVDQYRRWRQMRDEWRVQQAWEAAGNPVGSTPNPNFQFQ